jgi:hypothetical protein
VLRLLLEFGAEAPSLIERHRLRRALPLRLLGNLPVWDRERDGASPEGEVARAVARAVTGFLLEASERLGLVLLAAPPESSGAAERETVRVLVEAASEGNAPCASRHGLLLLVSRGAPKGRGPGPHGPGPSGCDPASASAYEQPLVAPQLTQT